MQVQLHETLSPELAASTGESAREQPGGWPGPRRRMVDLADSDLRAATGSPAAWRKSSYSNPSGECVELAPLSARSVAVRDSKYPDGAVLVFTRAEWEAFLADVRGVDGC